MAAFDLSAGVGRIRDVADVIHREWEETAEYWTDENSREIEENHLQPLFRELANAMNAMQRLDELARQARRECDPEECSY